MRRAWGLVCGEPYRIFFPLGVLAATAGAGHWLAYGLAWNPNISGFFHASVQVWLFMGSFALGFLSTFIPRFSGTKTASSAEISFFLITYAFIFVSLASARWMLAECFFIAWVIGLAIFAGRRLLSQKGIQPPPGFVWVPFALLQAVAGSLFLILAEMNQAPARLAVVGRAMEEQGFMLSLVVGIGGFLGPRLMGVPMTFPSNGLAAYNRKAVHAGAAVLFSASFFVEGSPYSVFGYALRAALVTAMLFLSNALPLRLPSANTLFRRLIRLSFLLAGAGVWSPALFFSQRATAMHVLFIGGFSLMIFTVATMVVLGHSGQAARLEKPLWILRALAAGIFASLFLRLSAPFFPHVFFPLLAAASAVWVLTGLAWLGFCIPFLLRSPYPAAFDRDHQKMKEGIAPSC